MHLQTCWAQIDLRVRLELVPALAFNVMHMQDGHLDLVGKTCPQALLRELPISVLAELQREGQTRGAAEIGPPSRRHHPHLVSFH